MKLKINQTHSSIVLARQKQNKEEWTTVAQWESSVNTIPKLPMGYKSRMELAGPYNIQECVRLRTPIILG